MRHPPAAQGRSEAARDAREEHRLQATSEDLRRLTPPAHFARPERTGYRLCLSALHGHAPTKLRVDIGVPPDANGVPSADDRDDEAADEFTRGFDMTFARVRCATCARSQMWFALIVFLGALALVLARTPAAQAQLVCSGSDVIPGVLASCPPPEREETPLPAIPDSQLREPLTYDEELGAIAARVPGFGGAFVKDRSKTLAVYLKSPSSQAARRAAALQLVERAFRKLAPMLDPTKIEVLEAKHDFRELKRWKDRMAQLFRIRGVMSIDIEESKNRLDVGVQNSRVRTAAARRLAQLDIPDEAVRFEVKKPSRADTSLQDRHFSPLVAGLQIAKAPLADGRIPVCTLGFVAYSARQGRWGFVTNSHCTDRRGGVESTRFYQPSRRGQLFLGRPGTDINDVGTELDDPGYYTCYAFYDCRYSDSAFVAFPSYFKFGSTFELGGIPDPVFGCCTLAYDQSRRGAFIGEAHPPEGHGVCKTGRTTGPTCGAITDTCDDSFMEGGYVYRCQFTAAYGRAGGDSGAPVWAGAAPAQAYLVGMHHGEQGGDGTFSPIGNIQRGGELGFLWNCRDFAC